MSETCYGKSSLEAYDDSSPGFDCFYNGRKGPRLLRLDSIRHNENVNMGMRDGYVEKFTLSMLKTVGANDDYPVYEYNKGFVKKN